MNGRDREESLTLEILEAIDQRSDITQRNLAQRTGVALGLANSYLKRCVRKGLVKIHQAPANRYLYYLTPKGFAEKSRLTAQYLAYSFEFHRRASAACAQVFRLCRRQGWDRVVFCGVSELAEIASLRALDHGVEVVGVYDPMGATDRFLGREVAQTLASCEPFDACVLTDLRDPHAALAHLEREIGAARVVVPGILGLRSSPAIQDE